LKLSERVDGKEMPLIRVVDLCQEKPPKGHRGPVILSKALREAVEGRLEKGEQAILFLNRRGFATNVQCPSCGYTEECPNCSVGLTYHRASGQLKCHLCGFAKNVPRNCPECQFDGYKYSGVGTQKIEDVVKAAFPVARWQRMDSDSMRGKFAYAKALGDFQRGKTDLLVGTQMIAKGLHFPNVTCVGVIATDAAFHLPDFRASERVFQQIVQVAGRAGRGDVEGEVFVQSYTVFHPAIQFARHHDVDGFVEQELEYRRAHEYPPFMRAVLVMMRGKSESKVEFCMETLVRRLKEKLPEGTVMDEAGPAPIAKMHGQFRYHLFLRTKKVVALSRLLKEEVLGQEWPDGVKATVNVDPVGLL
jgi:primosomal protein N' (replication factor Y)